jgi:hypothetical protein
MRKEGGYTSSRKRVLPGMVRQTLRRVMQSGEINCGHVSQWGKMLHRRSERGTHLIELARYSRIQDVSRTVLGDILVHFPV